MKRECGYYWCKIKDPGDRDSDDWMIFEFDNECGWTLCGEYSYDEEELEVDGRRIIRGD